MSSPQHPPEGEDPDDSEDWQIFEIRALGFELCEALSKPEASNMARVRQIEDHPWTYVSARMDRPEVVIEGSDMDSKSQLDETPSQPEASNVDRVRQIEDHPWNYALAIVTRPEVVSEGSDMDSESQLDETSSQSEASNVTRVQQIEGHPWTYASAIVDRPEVVVIEGSDMDSESQLDKTPSKSEASNADTEMHIKESLPNPFVFKTEDDLQIEDYPRTCASASVGNQRDVILIENSDHEASKPQGVWHIKEHQWAHVPSPTGGQQDLVVVKVFNMDGESKLSETLAKAEATNTYGESQVYETLPKPETFYKGSESQTAPKSEYKTLPKPETFYKGSESQTAPKSEYKTLPKPETFYMGSESQTAPKSEYKTLPKSEDSEAEGLHEDLIEIMREFNLDVHRTTQCLFFNSGEVGSTKHFLRTGLRPDGYPIWEPMDDEDLKKNKPKLRAQLVRKYGEENVAKRLAFLEC